MHLSPNKNTNILFIFTANHPEQICRYNLVQTTPKFAPIFEEKSRSECHKNRRQRPEIMSKNFGRDKSVYPQKK